MNDKAREKMLRAVPEGNEILWINDNVNQIVIKVSDGPGKMVVRCSSIAVKVPYTQLTCESIRVTDILAPDILTQFSKQVDEERKIMASEAKTPKQ